MEDWEDEYQKPTFILDTGGHCFLCIKTTAGGGGGGTCDVEDDDAQQEQDGDGLFSFQRICQYLKTNSEEVFREAVYSPESLKEFATAELKGMLCKGCSLRLQRLSTEILEQEVIQMKVQHSLKSISDMMVAVKEDDGGRTLADFKTEMKRQPLTSFHFGIVERLRQQILDGLKRRLITALPRVDVVRLTQEEIEKCRARGSTQNEEQPQTGPRVSAAATGVSQPVRDFGENDEMMMDQSSDSEPDVGSRSAPLDHSNPIEKVEASESDDEEKNQKTPSGQLTPAPPPPDENNLMMMKNRQTVVAPAATPTIGRRTIEMNLMIPSNHFSVNPATNKISCRLCPNQYSRRHNFYNHYKSAHLSVRFKCDLCGKRFTEKRNYRRHYLEVHFGATVRFSCKRCGKKFAKAGLMDAHERQCSSTSSGASSRGVGVSGGSLEQRPGPPIRMETEEGGGEGVPKNVVPIPNPEMNMNEGVISTPDVNLQGILGVSNEPNRQPGNGDEEGEEED